MINKVNEIIVIETWKIVDNWWCPKEEWIEREFAAVDWHGRAFIFIREIPDKVWRIYANHHL
jgi:hypothetical protein